MDRLRPRLIILLLAGILAPLGLSAQQAPRPTDKGLLKLTNTTTDSIRIELRVGRDTDCDQNTYSTSRMLAAGKSWFIRSDLAVCFRVQRDRQSPTWSGWSRRTMTRATVAVDSL